MRYLKIKKNTDFQKLFKGGKRVFSPCITLLYNPSNTLKMGIAVSKKHGKAVTRNKIKRLIRAAFFKTNIALKNSYSIIVLPKVLTEYSFVDFEKSLLTCFKKINSCAEN